MLTSTILALKNRLKVATLLLTVMLLQQFSSGQSIQFDQAQNGAGSPFTISWTNGILNATQTTYYEGVGTPQRLFIWGLSPGTHTLRIRHLAEASGSHAYDFIMSWQQAYQTAMNIGGGAGTNELMDLYNAHLRDAPVEFSASDFGAGVYTNTTGGKYKAGTYTSTSFGTPAGTLGSVESVLGCFIGQYGIPYFEIRGNQAVTSFTVTAIPGYDANYKVYELTWTSSSDRVFFRFAGHPAMGLAYPPSCGYGADQGAGSVSGGNYHIKLDYLDGSIGERDNQIMAGAFAPDPPTCSLTPGTSVCQGATSFNVTYSGNNAAGAIIKFYFLSNTAGAKFAGSSVSTTGSCSANNVTVTADGTGTATVTIVPTGSSFTPGSFLVGACVTTDGGSANCEQSSATTIYAATVTATANPTNISIISAAHNSTLSASAALNGTTNNSLFNFQWSMDPASAYTITSTISGYQVILKAPPYTVQGSLSAVTGATITFTADLGSVGSTLPFRVTATQIAAPNCSAFDDVNVSVSGTLTCPAVTTSPVCPNTTNSYTASVPPAAGETWLWTVNNGAVIVGPNNGQTVTVTADGQTFTLTLTKTYANTQLSPTVCNYQVVVLLSPGANAGAPQSACQTKPSGPTLFTMAGTATGTSYLWTQIASSGGASASIASPTVLNTAVSVSGTGSVTLQLASTNTCGTATSTVVLTVYPNPTANAGSPQSACQTRPRGPTQFTMAGSATNGTILWTKIATSGGADASITSPTALNTTVSVSGTGSVTLQLTTTSSNCGTATSTVVLTVYPNPTANAGTAPAPQCQNDRGNSFDLSGSGTNGTPSWSVAPGGNPSSLNVNIVNGNTYTPTIEVSGGTGTVTLMLTVTSTNCGTATSTVTVNVQPCGAPIFTYTQGYYGGRGKNCWTGDPITLMNQLLGSGGMVVGATPNYNVNILAGSGSTLNGIMPGSGTAMALWMNGTISPTSYSGLAIKNGRINNVLLSQVITLGFNLRLPGSTLSAFQIFNAGTPTNTWLTTIKVETGCYSYTATSCYDDLKYRISVQTSQAVINYFIGIGKSNANVWDLYQLANLVLGGQAPAGAPTPAEITMAVDAINRGFDQGRLFDGYYATDQTCVPITLVTTLRMAQDPANTSGKLSATAYPNPFNDQLQFIIQSPVDGHALLELTNILGQRIAVIYNGNVQANKAYRVDYRVPTSAPQSMLYVLRVGQNQVSGKLLRTRQ